MPEQVEAAFTTGATLANFTAMAAARHRLLARAGWDVGAQGLYGAPEIEVFVSEESHPTVRKGLGLLGLGRDRVRELPTDSNGRVLASGLPHFGAQSLVCVQAGNVNSGGFDPFPELVAACRDTGAWLHVDGAFGLWALASRSKKSLARGIEVWAALRSLGREGVESMIDRCCRYAEEFADGLREGGYEILNEVELNQVVVSFGDDVVNSAIIAAVQGDGVCWCGPTLWRGRSAMRISVSCWATVGDDVRRSLASILECARRVCQRRI